MSFSSYELKNVLYVLRKIIKEYKLEFNHKTKLYKSSEGFEFLGIKYIIMNNRLIKRISKRSKKKVLNKINKNNYKFYKHYLRYVK